MSAKVRCIALCAAAGLAGCNKDPVADPPNLLDTGWFDTATLPTPGACSALLVTSEPEHGEVGWYWRDRPRIFVGEDDRSAYTVWLEKAGGFDLPIEVVWDPSGVAATIEWDGWLEANTDYVLGVTDCAGIHQIGFRTSEFGRPLDDGPTTLEDRTYLLDFAGAEWVEPAILSALIQKYFNTPVLLGVRYVDETQIDIVGAPGTVDVFGNLSQDILSPTWDFPLTDFTTAPYLESQVDRITLQYRNGNTVLDVPVESFLLQVTFSGDGTRVGGGVLTGRADTRNLGSVVGDDDNPAALCNLAQGAGVSCIPCADGQPYCLNLVGEQISGEWIPGLTLVEIGG